MVSLQRRYFSESVETESSCDSDTTEEQPNRDSDENYGPNAKNIVTTFKEKDINSYNTIQRKPKRRPNPKIHNRNALMARENRRRKKEHMEQMERDVEMYRSENKQLRKDAKKRDNIIKQLRDEQMYLKSVLANKTEIMKLLRTIQGSKLPVTSSTLSMMTDDSINHIPATISQEHHYDSISSGCSRSPLSGDEFNHEKILGGIHSDDEFIRPPPTLDNWDDLLEAKPINDTSADCWQSNVKTDHNYFSSNTLCASKQSPIESAVRDPGVCLHVTGGRVSLEFCAACHLNSENAWIEEQ